MRTSLSIKTLFRTMAKTVFTFILIAAITFTLFSQVAEYITTKQEFTNNIDMYKGTGTVEVQPVKYKNSDYPYYIEADPRVDSYPAKEYNEMGYAKITTNMIEQIEAMQGVSRIYKRYMTGGIASMYRPVDEMSYDYAARLVVEGTLVSKDLEHPFYGSGYGFRGLSLDNCKILAGQADIEEATLDGDGQSMLIAYSNFINYTAAPMGNNDSYTAHYKAGKLHVISPIMLNYKYDAVYMHNFEIGKRYTFVLRYFRTEDPLSKGNVPFTISLYDFVTEAWCPAIWDIEDAPENYLELPEYAPLKTCIDITNQDIHTMDVVYTGDMSVIKRISDNAITLREGRWLTDEDTENNAQVCVINRDFASKNGLKLGDTISLKLGDELFEQFYGLGAVAVTPERFAENWTDNIDFEIVGLYSDPPLTAMLNPNWSYSASTVFVPLSFLPVSEDKLDDHLYSPAEFSFEVGNAWDIETFKTECIPQLEEMGLIVTFDDADWSEVVRSYETAQQLSIIRITLLTIVTVLATGFVVYLFITRKKKDYAIMRALGTPKKRSATSLLTPLMALTAVGVCVGVIAGVIYMLISSGNVSVLSIVFCLVGELSLTWLFASFILRKLSKRSPLELLQNSAGQKQKAVTDTPVRNVSLEFAAAVSSSTVVMKSEPERIVQVAKPKNPHHVRFVMRYIFRHIRRQALKSTLAVLLAALMVGAITQFAYMKNVYNNLRLETVIRPRFVNAIALNQMPRLEHEGLATDIYYEKTKDVDVHYGEHSYSLYTFVVTNDIGRYTGEEYEIEFAQGYDESYLHDFNNMLILGESLMDTYGFELGDTIKVSSAGRMDNIMQKARNSFVEMHSDLFPSDDLIFEMYGDGLNYEIASATDEFVIGGIIHTPSNAYVEMGFSTGSKNPSSALGTGIALDMAEFRLADNTRVEEMREYGEKFNIGNGSFIMDTSKLESVIRTSDLLNGLYPAAVAVALVIGAAMCALIVMQTSKDAAIMRAQGTTKRKTRAMLAVEQILLGAVGIAIGMCVMLAIKRNAFADIALQAGIFAAAYAVMVIAGSIVSAVFATKKNILELLQTKE